MIPWEEGMLEVASGVHVVDQPLNFLGLEIGARMTVLQLDGGVLVHSPVNISPDSIRGLGEPRWVLAPNKFHHLFVGPWMETGLEGWAAPGLPQKRSDLEFIGVVESGTNPFGSDVEVLALSCFSLSNEVTLYHKPSRTLVVSDLVFNLPKSTPWLTRAAMWCTCAYPGCRTSILERVGMKRKIAREEIRTILDYDFERVIMAHGDIIEHDAKAAFAQAYSWLNL